jgi:hypothetical protein
LAGCAALQGWYGGAKMPRLNQPLSEAEYATIASWLQPKQPFSSSRWPSSDSIIAAKADALSPPGGRF